MRTIARRTDLKWLGFLLVLGALLLGWGGSSQAEPPWTVKLTGAAAGGSDLDLASLTYAEAAEQLEVARDAGTGVALPVGPDGSPAVSLSNAEVATEETNRTLVVTGSADVLGLPAGAAVIGSWDSDADDAPSVTVAYRVDDASLADLAPSLDAVDVGLGSAWLAVRRDAADLSDVVVGDLPQAGQDFFDDGDDGTDDDFAVGAGVALRGVVDRGTPGLGEALQGMGARSVRLDGTLSTSDDALEAGAPAPRGFALSSALGVDSPARLPDWLTLGDAWTLDLATDGAGTLTAALGGGATLDLDGGAATGAATAQVTSTGDGVATTLSLEVGEISGAFGAGWLTLDGLALEAALDGSDTEGQVSSGITISDGATTRTGTVDVALANVGGELSAELDAALEGEIGARDLASLVGGNTSGLAGSLNPAISDTALHLAYDASAPGQVTVSATGSASVRLGGSPVGATALVRKSPDGLMIGARPKSRVTLSDLVGTVDPDPVLPDLAVTASTADLSAESADLDEPTRAYFAPLLCDDAAACDFDLDVQQGVGVLATITLPQALRDALGEIGVKADETLAVSGLVPAFGGSSTELAVALPGVSSGGKEVRDAALDLAIAKDGNDVTFALDGSMTLGIPRTESDTCPSGIRLDGGQCIDEVDFSVSATLAFTDTGVSFELLGGLDGGQGGWRQPFGITWLTLNEAKLKLAVTAGDRTAVEMGFLGRMVIGQTDLTIAGKAAVIPSAPFLELKGFTAASKQGVSMADLGSLYQQVSGDQNLDVNQLPDVGVRNLFLSMGTETDEDLCLRRGFYISGDLVIDPDKGPGGSVEPSCLPPEGDNGVEVTEECEKDSSCLASVLIDVQTGKGGGTPSINAAGYVTGWKAGPLEFDPTFVRLALDTAGASVYIRGGAALRDPVAYAGGSGNPGVWASGRITLEVTTRDLLVDAEVTLADGALGARVKGKGAFSLSTPDFDLKVYLVAPFLDDIAEEVEQVVADLEAGVNDAVNAVDDLADDMAATFTTNDPQKVYNNLRGALNRLGRGNVANWQRLVDDIAAMRRDIDSANDTLQDWGFGRPIPVNEILDAALFGVKTPDIPKVRECTRVFGERICVTLVPEIKIPDIPGACGSSPFRGTAICTRRNGRVDPRAVRGQFADPAIDAELTENGLAMPTGANSTRLVDTFRVVEPVEAAEVTCASADVSYSGDGSVGPTVLDLDTMGTEVTITGPAPGSLTHEGGATTAAVGDAGQDTVDALVTGSDETGCGDEVLVADKPTLSLGLDASVVEEGSRLTATGRAAGGQPGDSVTVAWGDGGTSSATVAQDLSWSATHTYADGGSADDPTSYAVTATSPGYVAASRRVVVANVAPTPTGLATSGPVDEGSEVTLTGAVTDPGTADTQTVTVDWGDGSAPERVELSGARITASHTYIDDLQGDLSGAGGEDSYQVSVTATDSDGDSGDAVLAQRVDNVAPGITGLASPAIDENGIAELSGTVVDPGVRDIHTVTVDWGDGSEVEELGTGVYDEGGVLVSKSDFTDAHLYPDDGPYTVTVTVADDDGGSVTEEIVQVVDNVAPVVETLEVAPIDEGGTARLEGTFSDVGTLDTHTVTVAWGDGSGASEVELAEDGTSFVDTHAFPDDNPTGTASDDYTVTVRVTDDDAGSVARTAAQTVDNVAPSGLQVRPSAGLTADPDGTLYTRAGVEEAWRGVVSDPGLEDTLTARIAWGDGRTSTEPVSGDGTPDGWSFASSHAWDGPALVEMSVRVADDDTGTSGTARRSVVVTRDAAGKAGGPGWWAAQAKRIARGQPSALTARDLVPYLAIARHVSTSFGERTPLGSARDASAVLSGGAGGPKVARERAKLERSLLVTLLDFVHGERAWDDVVIAEGAEAGTTYGELVARADTAAASGSVADLRAVRQALQGLY